MNANLINQPFTLPCGATLKNRLAKAAMTERIADKNLEPVKGHEILYSKWSNSGAGLLITGNVIIDTYHLESAGNVHFSDEGLLPKLSKWAEAGKDNNTHIWVQISHSGRQTNMFNKLHPLAPSSVKLNKLGLFGKPVAMTDSDIEEVISGFVRTADLSKKAGFTGVQIHSAHGYLLSQFLSPITNKRTDQWGGGIENRSRLLLKLVREIRSVVGPDYPISVKLNSSDFQKGGLTEEESLTVIKSLEKVGIDLLEISGGTYEKLAFFLLNDEKNEMRESTRIREAYFIDFAKKVRAISTIPLMITGGFRSFKGCNEALESGDLDIIGMARPFVTNLDDIPAFLEGKIPKLENQIIRTGIKAIEDAAEGGYYARQIIRTSKNKKYKSKLNALWSSVFLILNEFKKSLLRKI
jgi:2,4-dienoyl-CoA reductase-like NADH-dependent reductase (Old Yellow Enzyme family)